MFTVSKKRAPLNSLSGRGVQKYNFNVYTGYLFQRTHFPEPLTPALEDSTSSSGLHRHYTPVVHRHAGRQNTHNTRKIKISLFLKNLISNQRVALFLSKPPIAGEGRINPFT